MITDRYVRTAVWAVVLVLAIVHWTGAIVAAPATAAHAVEVAVGS